MRRAIGILALIPAVGGLGWWFRTEFMRDPMLWLRSMAATAFILFSIASAIYGVITLIGDDEEHEHNDGCGGVRCIPK